MSKDDYQTFENSHDAARSLLAGRPWWSRMAVRFWMLWYRVTRR